MESPPYLAAALVEVLGLSMPSDSDLYHELCAYTLTHTGASFIHQHVVDAFTAQHADERTKPIGLTFALVGLYLHVEKDFSGRQVQRAHMDLARHKRTWPTFVLPQNRGSISVADVMSAPAGPERDAAIHAWSAAVWSAFRENQPAIAELLRQRGIG
jgi:Family of unknown function (DUF5946)